MPRSGRVWQALSGLLLAVAVVAVAITLYRRTTTETLITIAPIAQAEGQTVTVFVGGAVNRPGVYTLPRGERIEGAIAAAGGFSPEADQDGINRALLSPAFNMIVHSAPFLDGLGDLYHWHVEIMPHLTKVAGFEWGSGFYINPTSPEEAAKVLRDATI